MALKTYKAKSVRISMQTAQNSINATPVWFTIPAASCNVKATEGSEKVTVIKGGAEPDATFLNGIDDISGSITFNLQYPLMPWLFGASIGATTPSNAAVGTWTLSTAYAVGDIVSGTTPATDDLVAHSISGLGTSGLTAPATTALADRDLVVDNLVEWAARKGDLKIYAGSLDACLDFFTIEVEVEADCQVETLFFRKIGCRVKTLGLNFDKNSGILAADIAVVGTRAEMNIKPDGTLDATYKDLSTITGNTEVSLEEERYVKKSELDFLYDGVASDYVESFSITVDNVQEVKTLLSKQNGENSKAIYSSGSKVINGSISAMFDTVIQGSMDGVTMKPIVVSADSGFGDKFSLNLPLTKLDRSEPDLSTATLMLSPSWTAQPVTGASALQYSTTSLSVPYKA